METNIVVVDDEKEIADLVQLYLENENYHVHTFYDAVQAYEFMCKEPVDLAIIDIMMPIMDGFTLCQKLREQFTFPILMLTAKIDEVDKIQGLTLGADDYITKPFRPLELVARVKAQLRRYKKYNQKEQKEDHLIEISGLVLDLKKHQCFLNERELILTPIEFSILEVLCTHPNQVLSPDVLFQKVWKEKYFKNSNNTVMVHIRHLREKMNDTTEKPKYIKTVWGVGYKIEK